LGCHTQDFKNRSSYKVIERFYEAKVAVDVTRGSRLNTLRGAEGVLQ